MKKVLGLIMFICFFAFTAFTAFGNNINPNQSSGVVIQVNVGTGIVVVRDTESGELVTSTNRANFNISIGDDVKYIFIKTRGGGIHIVLTDRK